MILAQRLQVEMTDLSLILIFIFLPGINIDLHIRQIFEFVSEFDLKKIAEKNEAKQIKNKNGKKDNLLFSTQRIYNEYDKSDIRGKKAKWKKTKRDFSIAAINNKNGNYQLNHPQEYISKDKTKSLVVILKMNLMQQRE